jgi:hypothetical protein
MVLEFGLVFGGVTLMDSPGLTTQSGLDATVILRPLLDGPNGSDELGKTPSECLLTADDRGQNHVLLPGGKKPEDQTDS